MEYFSFYIIIYLFTFLTNIFLGLLVFLKNKKSKLNRSFTWFSLSIAGWILTLFLLYYYQGKYLLLIGRLNFLFAALVAFFFFFFAYVFPEKKVVIKPIIRMILKLWMIILGVIILLTDFIDKQESLIDGKLQTTLGDLYFIFAIHFFGLTIGAVIIILLKYNKVNPLHKYQIKYFIFGSFLLAVFPASITNIILPWLFNYLELQKLAPIFSLLLVITIAYSILRYRLMDIRIIVRKIFIYFGIAVFAYSFFYFLSWLYTKVFGSVFSLSSYLAGLIIAPLFVVIFYELDRSLKNFANKYLFVSLYNYQETINKLTDELNYYIELKKIINLIVDTIQKTMQLDKSAILLADNNHNGKTKRKEYKVIKLVGFNRKQMSDLAKNDFFINYLRKNLKPIVKDEVKLLSKEAKTQKERNGFAKLLEQMRDFEVFLFLPITNREKMIGILVLGKKIANDIYTKEDLELLNTVSKQAGIAIENALFYKQVQDFSRTLQEKVSEQTQDIEEKSRHLQELIDMKNDFLRVVNHQLNTPISIMKGYFSILDEGVCPDEKAMSSIRSGLDRISSTVADFWNAYELEGERMKMNPQKTDIVEIINRLIAEKRKMQLAVQRDLEITMENPDFKIPWIWCDYKKIAHVVSNLLDNAVYYTRSGKIKVYFELKGRNYLKVNVKDTGVGIWGEDKQKIFKKFSRGQDATNFRPDGSGLGLFIAKKIIEGNGGNLTYVSKGKDKGTTFSFTIPVYNNQKSDNDNKAPVSRKKIVIFNKN